MKIKVLFFLLFCSGVIFSQVITVTPDFPSENDSIKITVNIKNATRKDLLGYTGDLYTHTGVTTTAKWQNVIGSWGNNATQPKLTRTGTDLYELVIGRPHTYYSVASTVKITELCFVFRSSDGSKQTEDLFITLYEKGLNISITSPAQFPVFVKLNDAIPVKATASNAVKISLYENNKLITEAAGTNLAYDLTAKTYGKNQVKLVAQDNSGNTKADSFYYMVNPPQSVKVLPSGMNDGINYVDSKTVTLSLYAPQKSFVYVIGDFNNWEADSAYFMNITPDNTRYWITLSNLTPGQEYAFQYFVDGQIRIADPYTDKILDPNNDKYITPAVYPGLKPYPDGKTTQAVSVLQTAQAPYAWQASGFKRPDRNSLVIYELLVRDFTSTHTYKALADTVSYLASLGINAVELMPVNEFEGNDGWGYNPSFYFAPDKYYGPKNELKRFIDECHKRNIAVIIDLVLNHSYGSSPLVRLYFDVSTGKPAANNPWYNVNSNFLNPDAQWGYDFNHESPLTQQFVDRVTSYWIKEYKVDGYRFDFTKGFSNNIKPATGDNWGSAYDADRIRILERMTDKIRQTDSTAYVIFEHLADNSEETVLANYGIMLWGNMNYNYNEATMGWLSNSNFSSISYKNRGWSYPNLVGYMESHDEERLMFKNLKYGNSGNPLYNIQDTLVAINRMKLANAFFIPVPGPKMIWQFGELGYDYSIDYNGRLGAKPVRWDYHNNPARKKLFKVVQALNNLKTKYPAFSSADFSVSANGSVKSLQIRHASMDVNIVGNFWITSFETPAGFTKTGKWYDYFTGNEINVADTQMQLTLQPSEFHIYTTVKLPTPEADILNDVEKMENSSISSYGLEQNYPNPFNPTTMISFNVARTSNVSLKIYDIMGREVKTLVNREMPAGSYRAEWKGDNNNGNQVTAAMYIYRIDAGSFTMSRKMMLVK